MIPRAWQLALALTLPTLHASASEPVRYCDYPVYPPISWSDGHQVRGLAPTVVRELFARMGYEVQTVVLGNWKRCLMDAAAGRWTWSWPTTATNVTSVCVFPRSR